MGAGKEVKERTQPMMMLPAPASAGNMETKQGSRASCEELLSNTLKECRSLPKTQRTEAQIKAGPQSQEGDSEHGTTHINEETSKTVALKDFIAYLLISCQMTYALPSKVGRARESASILL